MFILVRGEITIQHIVQIFSYSDLLPLLFQLNAGNFYLEYAGEKNKKNVLNSIKQNIKPGQQIFLGVTNVLDPRVETPEEIRDVILEAAEMIPAGQLGSTDDCGFSPFADDTSDCEGNCFYQNKSSCRRHKTGRRSHE